MKEKTHGRDKVSTPGSNQGTVKYMKEKRLNLDLDPDIILGEFYSFLFLKSFLKNLFTFNWRMIALQCCVGFYNTST